MSYKNKDELYASVQHWHRLREEQRRRYAAAPPKMEFFCGTSIPTTRKPKPKESALKCFRKSIKKFVKSLTKD